MEMTIGCIDGAAVKLLVFRPPWIVGQIRRQRMNIDTAPFGAGKAFADGLGQGHIAAADIQAPEGGVVGV